MGHGVFENSTIQAHFTETAQFLEIALKILWAFQNFGKSWKYKILLPDHYHLHLVFHVSQLKKHIGPRVVPSKELPFVDDNGNIKVSICYSGKKDGSKKQ